MLAFFPKAISRKGLLLYVICLTTVSLVFYNYVMSWWWAALGLLEILLFFVAAGSLTMQWRQQNSKYFVRNIFWLALALRIIWVLFSYYYYIKETGIPFELDSKDAIGYHEEAEWLAGTSWKEVWNYLFVSRMGYSDSGYPLYLTVLYKMIGPNIIVTRILKSFYSSLTCVLIYQLAKRCMGEEVGRMAALFAVFMPNLIVYCGLHLKETEMLLLVVAFLERTDYLYRVKKYTVWRILIPVLLAGSLFLFRTVLGVVAVFSFFTGLVFSPTLKRNKGRKVLLTTWAIVAVLVLAGGVFATEIEGLWQNREVNQEAKRMEQTIRGNRWAKYATGAVMAPMVFVLPFSTMVDTEQEIQLTLHAGNFVRNFMGVFVIITLLNCLFIKKNWRDFALIGSFVIAYLGVISMTGFANSERFLLPGLPGLIIMWAYGLSVLNAKSYRFVKYWFLLIPLMEIGWAYFKLGSRGIVG